MSEKECKKPLSRFLDRCWRCVFGRKKPAVNAMRICDANNSEQLVIRVVGPGEGIEKNIGSGDEALQKKDTGLLEFYSEAKSGDGKILVDSLAQDLITSVFEESNSFVTEKQNISDDTKLKSQKLTENYIKTNTTLLELKNTEQSVDCVQKSEEISICKSDSASCDDFCSMSILASESQNDGRKLSCTVVLLNSDSEADNDKVSSFDDENTTRNKKGTEKSTVSIEANIFGPGVQESIEVSQALEDPVTADNLIDSKNCLSYESESALQTLLQVEQSNLTQNSADSGLDNSCISIDYDQIVKEEDSKSQNESEKPVISVEELLEADDNSISESKNQIDVNDGLYVENSLPSLSAKDKKMEVNEINFYQDENSEHSKLDAMELGHEEYLVMESLPDYFQSSNINLKDEPLMNELGCGDQGDRLVFTPVDSQPFLVQEDDENQDMDNFSQNTLHDQDIEISESSIAVVETSEQDGDKNGHEEMLNVKDLPEETQPSDENECSNINNVQDGQNQKKKKRKKNKKQIENKIEEVLVSEKVEDMNAPISKSVKNTNEKLENVSKPCSATSDISGVSNQSNQSKKKKKKQNIINTEDLSIQQPEVIQEIQQSISTSSSRSEISNQSNQNQRRKKGKRKNVP